MAHLAIVKGLNPGQSFPIAKEILLGRNVEEGISFPDGRVSRTHARIIQHEGGYAIEDLNSANGTHVDGERIPPQTLRSLVHGDEVLIGSTLIVFFDTASEEDPSESSLSNDPGVNAARNSEKPSSAPVHMLGEVKRQPTVALTLDPSMSMTVLDASTNMSVVDENEQATSKGLHDAIKRLQAMCQVSTVLGTITDQAQLMQQITSCIFDIFPAAERVLILLHDNEIHDFTPLVAVTRHGAEDASGNVAISRSIIREVTTYKRSVLSLNTLDDERFSEQASVIDLAIRSMMCAPLLVGNEVLGVIQVDTQSLQHRFTSEDLQVLTGISTQAAIAVKNAQLYEMVETETARRTSLQRYFSPKLVEMFMSGDITTALGGKAYHGTILFSDIIGFTAMSEGMSPADLVAKLNRYFTITQKLIHENGGNVDKFNGDGVMAFWGVPQCGPHDELDALMAALHMQKALWAFNLELEAEHQPPILMAIGLNSGEFVAGNVGSKDKIEFTLIGDTVNLAARIEQLASRYQVLVPETIWERIKHQVASVKLPLVRVKGKSTPITVYSIRCVHHPVHEGYSMAIPCHLLDAGGKQAGRGILTKGQLTKTGPCWRLNTDVPLEQGSVAVLQLVLPEYHKQLLVSARVHRAVTGCHRGSLPYTKAVLSNVQGESTIDFLRPGGLLTTVHSWDDLKRG